MSDQFDFVFDQLQMHEHPWQRQTSLEAWNSVFSSGWATKKMKSAYDILFRSGPLTLLELEHQSAAEDGRRARGRSESTVIRRLYDLRDNALVYVTPLVRECAISGKRAVTWDVTLNLSPKERIQKQIQRCPKCGEII